MSKIYNCCLKEYHWSYNAHNYELSLMLDNSDTKQFYIALFINGDNEAVFTKDFDDLGSASKSFNEIVAAAKL